jgi:hypothetical protein
MALLLMYLLRSMESILDLVRFLKTNPEWLVTLNLRRKVRGVMTYRVPDRSTFYKFAGRVGVDGIIEVFSIIMVARLIKMGIINKGREEGLPGLLDHLGMVQGLPLGEQAQSQEQKM